MELSAPSSNTASCSVAPLAAPNAAPPTAEASTVPTTPDECRPDEPEAADHDEQCMAMSSAPMSEQRSIDHNTAQKSSAAKSRWRFKLRAFYRGVGCSGPPPGLRHTDDAEKANIWNDDFWFQKKHQGGITTSPGHHTAVEYQIFDGDTDTEQEEE